MPDPTSRNLPRPLDVSERRTLLTLLDHAGFRGRGELREQVDHARVVGVCDCGCATVDLEVDAAAPPAPRDTPSPIPNEATVLGEDGGASGGVLVFVSDEGRLSMLEVYSYDVEPISEFPPPERLELTTLGRRPGL